MKKQLLLLFAFLCSMGMWAEEETLASFSNSDNEGWTISGSPSYSSTGGYQLVSSDKSITSTSINFSNYKNVNITITARKYGGPNATQGKISVKQGSTELATYSPSSTTLTASDALAISPSDGTLTISCPGASSSKGCGISAIVIKGTPKGDSPEPTDPDPEPEPELKGYNSGTLGYNAFNLVPDGTNTYAQPSNAESHSITFDGINLTLTKNDGTALRFDESYVRVYQKNTMTITAPTGRKIAKIELNKAGGDWKSGMTVSPTCSTYKDGDETPTWTGSATSVSFTPGGTHRLASVTVYLEAETPEDPVPTFASLDELIAANLEEPIVVNVTIDNPVLQAVNMGESNIVYIDNNGDYIVLAAPGSDLGWEMGGTVSGTLNNVTWDPEEYTIQSETDFWSSLEYTAPAGAPTETIYVNPACTDGDLYYSTYSSANAFYVPEDITVYEVAIVDDELLFDNYKTGDLVPPYRGVIICATEGGNFDVEIETDNDMWELAESVLGDDNALRPTCFEGGLTADDMAAEDPGMKYYRLTMHNGTQCGFWWGAAEGAAFNIAENKAYLVAGPAVNKAKGFSFKDITTGIEKAMAEKANNEVRYNLNGQRVNANAKGIIIVNGKKFIKK